MTPGAGKRANLRGDRERRIAARHGASRGRAPWLNAGRLAVHAPTWPEGCTNLSPRVFPAAASTYRPFPVTYSYRTPLTALNALGT
eukprot:3627002-Prymnesium_polylepis.1